MLSPRQVIDTMTLKHGVATSDDVSALKEPLSRALTSLSNLPNHMNLFLLASQRCQRLTRSGQGETDFNYFKLFLENGVGLPLGRAMYAGILHTVPGHTTTEPCYHFPVPGKNSGSPGPV
jgi:hypothetical protein